MNPALIRAKLESLARCIARLREKTPPTKEQFTEDWDAQDLVMKNLERAVQVCVDVANHLLSDEGTPPPGSMAMAFVALAWVGVVDMPLAERLRSAVGLRNLAVHEYESINYSRVYDTVTTSLGVFEDFARAVLNHLNSLEE